MLTAATTRRLLRSPLIDLLVGPHGIDRYLELIRPDLTVHDARAEVVAVRRQTERSVTLTLRPNAAWSGFHAGQFVRVGLEIDGIRRTRTYSPASSQHQRSRGVELTVTVHPQGLVSRHLRSRLAPGAILHLDCAQGDFVLPEPRPTRLVLISGGSGVTPVISMLRTLCDEQHSGEIVFVHYARTAADWLYRSELDEIAARHGNVRVLYIATREGGGHLSAGAMRQWVGEPTGAGAAVCGPPSLIAAVRESWEQIGGPPQAVLAETFTPLSASLATATAAANGTAAQGTIRFLRSDRAAPVGPGTLLEQAEAAALSPKFGCRMGICHTCTCRKAAGSVRNVLTGEVSAEQDEDIQLCVSVPQGDIALDL